MSAKNHDSALDHNPADVPTRPVHHARRASGARSAAPRIANKLGSLWANAALCNRYLRSLLMDSRDGAREGFSMAVAAELAALFGSVDPSVKEQPWGQVKGAR